MFSLALFGMLGGMGTALWGRSTRSQPQVLSIFVMGVIGITSMFIASAVGVVSLYLALGALGTVVQQLGEPFTSFYLVPALVSGAVAGAIGGAIGGTLGEGVASTVHGARTRSSAAGCAGADRFRPRA